MLKHPFRRRSMPREQRGVMLIEALIGILIFSIGILALIAMQAQAFRQAAEAKYRSDASYLANSIIGRMWTDRANLASYAHRQTDTAGQNCLPTGTNSTYNYVTAVWLPKVAAALPGATTATQQIKVNTLTNQVTVSVCWMSPQDNLPHRHIVTAYINV
jgi:type IV pilus assembly protein PilV